jgi:hypothetical protein
MEISPFTVYLWQQADSFVSFAVGTSIALVALAMLISMINYCEHGLDKPMPKSFSVFLSCALVLACFGALTPSSKTIAMMYAVPAIVNSKVVQEDLPEIYQMGVDSLKKQLAPKAKSANVEASK